MPKTSPYLSEGCPDVVAAWDLNQPGLFEASAGTGKTYAIEHLILRLLIECDDLDLEKILVLTFTEKATGELKEKIRNRIALRLKQGNLPTAIARRLKEALLGFDRASIHTIHGFCDRVLKKYAFENRSLFQNTLVKKSKEVFQQVLREEMRTTWISEAGEGESGRQAFIAMAESLGFQSGNTWEGKILHLAQEFNPSRGDRLLPEFSAQKLAEVNRTIGNCPVKIAELFPELESGQEAAHPFILAYRKIKFSNTSLKKQGPLILEAALKLATEFGLQPAESRLQATVQYLESIKLRAVHKESFTYLLPNSDEYPSSPWPLLNALIDILLEMQKAVADRDIEIEKKAFENQRRVILSLREKTQAFKRVHGMLTFNNMIEDVWNAIQKNRQCIQILRQDYRYCLVDEFQDTDPLQWNIFRTVFLESGTANPLFLIGDPKQAIYRFRGGDIHTYLAARDTLYTLSRQGLAQGMGLATNFRSSAKVVDACNAVFTQAGWFHDLKANPEDTHWFLPATSDPLGYVTVQGGHLPVQEALDSTGQPAPIILKDFSSALNVKKATLQKRAYAWITAEISRLMANPQSLQVMDKTTKVLRPLQWNDICVLVGTGAEKRRVEKACVQVGIPTQVEKEAGLYDGKVADEFLAVLESLEDPGNSGKHARALLTRFFRYAGVAPAQGLPENTHPFFESWSQWAERKHWQRLFHAMLYRTGILYRASLEPDGDRVIMDFQHIGQNLVQEALSQSLDLAGLVRTLRELRLGTALTEDEQDFHREDSEGHKVSLMTMHVSKGLEFPVVFLASTSRGRTPEYFKYREGLNTIYQLDTKDANAIAAHKLEAENEERRLFYVALTRARYKLYVPVFPKPQGTTQFGPLGGFVGQALLAAAVHHPSLFLFSKVDQVPDAAQASVPEIKSILSLRSLPEYFFADFPQTDPLALPTADFSKRRRRLLSYSQLVHHSHGITVDAVEGRFDKEESPVAEEIPDSAEGSESVQPLPSPYPANTLPRGKDIGNMFHEILEDIDFAVVAQALEPDALLLHRPTLDLITERMRDYRLEETWLAAVTGVVWNTLHAKIPDPFGDDAFALTQVSNYRPEMEFLFPYPAQLGDAGPDGYMGGFIDLVFRYRGRYYLLDWKSNYLERYDRIDLEASIQASQYDLQYMLYSLALDKWLRSLIPDYDFDIHFGGLYYIYLRGMRIADPSGIFAFRPTLDQMQTQFPEHLAKVMAATGIHHPLGAAHLLGRNAGVE